MPEKSTCRLCGRPIVWIRSAASGCIVALDAEPSAQGTHGIIGGESVLLSDHVFNALYSGPCYAQHMTTCPKKPKPPKQ